MASSTRPLGPEAQLAFFVFLQLLTYCDRNVVAGVLPAAEHHFQLTGIQSGLLGSGFMGGFIVVGPLVAASAAGTNTSRMIYTILAGIAIWSLAVLATGLAPSYESLLIARVLTGFGEAAYCPLGPVLVQECAPDGKSALYVGIYFASTYVGMAIGFIFPSLACFKVWSTGRFIFVAEAFVAIPFLVFGFLNVDRFQLRADRARETLVEQRVSTSEQRELGAGANASLESTPRLAQMLLVLLSPRFALLLLGCASCIFTAYSLSFWAPSYLQEVLLASKGVSGLLLSADTALAGLIATAAGGWMLDRISAREKAEHDRYKEACRLAFLLSLGCGPCFMSAVLFKSVPVFICCTFVGMCFTFALVAPAQIAMMESIPPAQKSIAMGLSTTGTHLLGDLISPGLVGYVRDRTGSLVPGMWLIAAWICQACVWYRLALSAPPFRVPGREASRERNAAAEAQMIASNGAT